MQNKRSLIIFFVLFSIILGFTVFSKYIYKKTYEKLVPIFSDKYATENKRTVEHGDTVDHASVLTNDNALFRGIIFRDKTQLVQYMLSTTDALNRVVEKKVEIPFIVTDTKPPIIELNNDKVEVYVGEEYDINDNVASVYDAIDGKLEYTVSEDINNKETGEYPVQISATDKNGLTTTEEFVVEVIEKPKQQKTVFKNNADTSSGVYSLIGSAGSIRVGGYNAALEYCSVAAENCQGVFDAYGIAAISQNFAGTTIIFDHDSHGFSSLINNGSLSILWPDGREETFYKVSSHFQSVKDGEWYSDDGYDNLYGNDGRLCTQTCLGAGKMWVYWN